jgi:hypothetical protein
VRSRVEFRQGLLAGAVAGVAAGTPSTLHAAVTRRPVTASTRAIAGLLGLDRAPAPVQLVAGAAVHAGLSIGWATVAARALPRRHPVLAGTVAGVAVGVVDLGIGRRRVPAIRALPYWPQLVDHALFGAVTGAVLARLRRQRAAAEVEQRAGHDLVVGPFHEGPSRREQPPEEPLPQGQFPPQPG